MFKNKNWLWFEIIIIFKYEQGIETLSKIHIYSKMMKKKNMLCTWITISIYYKLQKNCSKIHSYEKVLLGKKICNLFLK
jgi:hypothetical protein